MLLCLLQFGASYVLKRDFTSPLLQKAAAKNRSIRAVKVGKGFYLLVSLKCAEIFELATFSETKLTHEVVTGDITKCCTCIFCL